MIAKIALLLWPVVMMSLYRKYTLPVAFVGSLVGAYLVLPQAGLIDLPVLPSLNRTNLPVLVALVLTVIAVHKQGCPAHAPQGWVSRNIMINICVALLIIGPFLTASTNSDTLVYGDRVIGGLRMYDAFSVVMHSMMYMATFFMARRVLYSLEAQKVLLMGFAIGALCYTPLVLYEIRMSPQLHTKVYGFFQHSFAQHVRGDGFRPVVFLDHGLSLSLFLTSSVLAAVGLMRISAEDQRLKWAVLAAYLLVVMVLSKSLGPLLITAVLLPFAAMTKPRMQLMVAACVAGMVLTYPALRAAHVIPVGQIASFAQSIDEQRAESFIIRLDNEEAILEKTQQRPLYGWGIWGRNRIYDHKGRNLSITDGSWIITLSSGGWVRYIGFFGLLCWPVIGLFLSRRTKIDPVATTLALILCAKLVDLIPNSGTPHIYWLIAGALLGRLEMKQGVSDTTPVPEKADSRPGYTREEMPEGVVRGQEPRYARSLSGKPSKRASPEKVARTASYKRPASGADYRR